MLFAVIAVLSAALVALLLARFVSTESGTVTTASGEQRTVVLADGSRVTLNTDTRIAVRYDERTRRVRLDRGEALFDVRPEHDRPFVVVAGRRAVRALGTAFDVRREDTGKLSVTLIQGRISIVPAAGQPEPTVMDAERLPDATVLASPGERATFTPDNRPALDHPPLRQVIAWQSGQVVFNHTPLPEAVREMNRYSDRRIALEGSGMESLHVGGLFQAGETAAFARAIAETFGLRMHEARDRIVLSRPTGSSLPLPLRRGSSSAR
jgi:transmembrane sensor